VADGFQCTWRSMNEPVLPMLLWYCAVTQSGRAAISWLYDTTPVRYAIPWDATSMQG
jgi:hypothetical protein